MKHLISLVTAAVVVAICACSGEKIAGTNDETKVVGTVMTSDGSPAAKSRVRIFMVDDTSRTTTYQTRTDANGTYEVTAPLKGEYNIIADLDSSGGLLDSVHIASETRSIDTIVLGPVGTLHGTAKVQFNHDPRTVTVQVLGTYYYTNVDSLGGFNLADLPQGQYRLRMISTIPEYTPTYFVVQIRSGHHDTASTPFELTYTGIPAVTGITAQYDTLTGVVHLHWNATGYRDFLEYTIYQDDAGQSQPSEYPLYRTRNTTVNDTIAQMLLGSATTLSLRYRVAVRSLSFTEGVTYGFAAVSAVSPLRNYSLNAPLVGSEVKLSTPSVLQWNRLTGAASYRVQIARTDSLLATSIADNMVMDTLVSDSFLTFTPQTAGLYFWRVGGVNKDGEFGFWGRSGEFGCNVFTKMLWSSGTYKNPNAIIGATSQGYIIQYTDFDNIHYSSNIALFDTTGTIIRVVQKTLDFYYTTSAKIPDGSGTIIIGNKIPYFCSDSILLIHKVDITGNTVWLNELKVGQIIPQSVLPTRDGGFLIGGSNIIEQLGSSLIKVPVLLKCDQNGSVKWQNEYGAPDTTIQNSSQAYLDGIYTIFEDAKLNRVEAVTYINHSLAILNLTSTGDSIALHTLNIGNPNMSYLHAGKLVNGNYLVGTWDPGGMIQYFSVTPDFSSVLLKYQSIRAYNKPLLKQFKNGVFFALADEGGIFDDQGNLLWVNTTPYSIADAILLPDGGLLYLGRGILPILAKVSSTGDGWYLPPVQ